MKITAAITATALAIRSSPSAAFVNPAPSRLDAPRSTLLRDVATEESAAAAAPPPPKSSVKISPERIVKATKERPYPLFLAEKAAQLLIDPLSSPSLPSPLSDTPKETIVVLGTGWGAAAFLKNIDTDKYDVTVVSPRNYFVFTPMLAGASVGSVDFKSITEPIREVRVPFVSVYPIIEGTRKQDIL